VYIYSVNYYNEIDPKAAQWLRTLISANLIPQGDVDTRSIVEVRPADLAPYTQCHFFAGIGGWPYALQLAGVPATTPLWTGSCPCQPFSSAGKGLAQADERHLWPVFFDLIRQCRPDTVFGEQVASAIGKGWLDGVSSDLERENYACGAAVLGAHSVGAPHIRQRLYWVAHSQLQHERSTEPHGTRAGDFVGLREAGGLGNAERQQHERRGGIGNVGRPPDQKQGETRERQRSGEANSGSGADYHGLVLTNSDGCQPGSAAASPAGYGGAAESAGFWDDARLVACRDGKTRRIPTEPAFFPLAHGLPARVALLRGYGNAIVPQVAAEFIQAFYETQEDQDFC